jgi:hypothetical protein
MQGNVLYRGNLMLSLQAIGSFIINQLPADVETHEKYLRYDLSIQPSQGKVRFDSTSITALTKVFNDRQSSSMVKSLLKTLQNELPFLNIRGNIKFGACSAHYFNIYKFHYNHSNIQIKLDLLSENKSLACLLI